MIVRVEQPSIKRRTLIKRTMRTKEKEEENTGEPPATESTETANQEENTQQVNRVFKEKAEEAPNQQQQSLEDEETVASGYDQAPSEDTRKRGRRIRQVSTPQSQATNQSNTDIRRPVRRSTRKRKTVRKD